MDISKNYFELFGLPQSYTVDLSSLSNAYIELQRQAHPDRHAHLSDRDVRMSEQYTAFINEAFGALKSPLKRAIYMLSLVGVDVSGDTTVTFEPMFLMQQMELREQLSDLSGADDPHDELDALESQVSSSLAKMRTQFELAFSERNFDAGAVLVRKMQFFEKLMSEISDLEARLDD